MTPILSCSGAWQSSWHSSRPQRARSSCCDIQEDLDPVDIASTLDMPINTVKSHLKRSLTSLRARVLGAAIVDDDIQPSLSEPSR